MPDMLIVRQDRLTYRVGKLFVRRAAPHGWWICPQDNGGPIVHTSPTLEEALDFLADARVVFALGREHFDMDDIGPRSGR